MTGEGPKKLEIYVFNILSYCTDHITGINGGGGVLFDVIELTIFNEFSPKMLGFAAAILRLAIKIPAFARKLFFRRRIFANFTKNSEICKN